MNRVAIVDYGLCNLDSVARAVEECGGNRARHRRARRPRAAPTASSCRASARFRTRWRNLRALGPRRRARPSRSSATAMPVPRHLPRHAAAGRRAATRCARPRGLGWIDGDVVLLDAGPGERVPHIGWNEVDPTGRHRRCSTGSRRGRTSTSCTATCCGPRRRRTWPATTPYGGGFASVGASRTTSSASSSIPRRASGRFPGARATSWRCRTGRAEDPGHADAAVQGLRAS